MLTSKNNPIDNMRDKGIELAWRYEQAELQMGGIGTRDWTPKQKYEILYKGKAKNFEGHHINSVGNNPLQQANPDNVEFLGEHRKDHGVREHFNKHGRNWHNQTEGDLIDRNERLKKRTIKGCLKMKLRVEE